MTQVGGESVRYITVPHRLPSVQYMPVFNNLTDFFVPHRFYLTQDSPDVFWDETWDRAWGS